MADSKLDSPRSGVGSPPPNCAICLGSCTNKCYSDSCMHEFCFKCLLEWSKIKAECPLCKQTFKSIIHNIKSNNEYDEHLVENVTVEENRFIENASLIYLPPATPPTALHQYHFRTTFTVDSHGEHAIQQMLLSHPLLSLGNFSPDRYNHHRRRNRPDTSATTFRRSIYNQNLWVYAPPDITGRYRDVSPSFFRNNPAARTRLVPWLNRELNALLYENTQQVMRLVDIIMDHLLRHHICSYMFRSLLSDYLGNKTDHFIHEFYNFMRSPFDMIGYDRHVIYTERRPSPLPLVDEIDVSDYDSDVILVSDTNNNNNHQREPVTTDPVVINLVDTDSDEPIIVSEERGGVVRETGAQGNNNVEEEEEEENNRKPILPLKLRIKNRRRSREKRSRGKKRHRQGTICSSRSASTSSSSSSSSSSSTESSSESDCYYKRKKMRKHSRKDKKRKQQQQENDKSSDNDEDDLPLSSFATRKKRSKHHKKSSHHRHHHSSEESNHNHHHHNHHHYSSSTNNNTNKKCEPSTSSCSYSENSNLVENGEGVNSSSNSSSINNGGDGWRRRRRSGDNNGYNNNNNDSNSDDSFYSEHKPFVKSEIKDPRSEDSSNVTVKQSNNSNNNKAGPSSGRLRSMLKKEANTNLWYSRPCFYESDSSDN